MAHLTIQQTAQRYYELYKKLYQREPRDLRILDHEFVIVNETQIRLSDLVLLADQLEQEYKSQQQNQRGTILRLIRWFRKS